MRISARRWLSGLLLVVTFAGPTVVKAGSLWKAGARGAARGLAGKVHVYRRPLGPRHHFTYETRLERYSNRPRTDKIRGLPPHSFWKRPEPGRKGSAEHVRRKLDVPHQVRQREEVIVKPGTLYHERPIKGGRGHSREVILEHRVPADALKLRERLRQ